MLVAGLVMDLKRLAKAQGRRERKGFFLCEAEDASSDLLKTLLYFSLRSFAPSRLCETLFRSSSTLSARPAQ